MRAVLSVRRDELKTRSSIFFLPDEPSARKAERSARSTRERFNYFKGNECVYLAVCVHGRMRAWASRRNIAVLVHNKKKENAIPFVLIFKPTRVWWRGAVRAEAVKAKTHGEGLQFHLVKLDSRVAATISIFRSDFSAEARSRQFVAIIFMNSRPVRIRRDVEIRLVSPRYSRLVFLIINSTSVRLFARACQSVDASARWMPRRLLALRYYRVSLSYVQSVILIAFGILYY